jgi:diguanylate cyclase (GGDEF)-like protein/PAS domain S-box-containing protein/putative nucleotidyltransferase with HDIG domain
MYPAQPPRPSVAQSVPEVSSGVIPKCETAQDRLAQSRLGVFTGLFYALRAKHPPTAAHALRVALGCSKWSGWRELGEPDRSLLEVAALLHDIGKIGIPDHVLQKPSELDGPEQVMMEMHCAVAAELLRGAGASGELIELVRQSRMAFGSKPEDLSVSARMLAIVDAFDSMTTEQVFRRAMSHERAVDELFAHAGTQFDPQLVQEFSQLLSEPRPKLEGLMADRWLNQFVPDLTPGFWESDVPVSSGGLQNLVDTLFHRRLLDSLPDAAVYLDAEGQVLHWNRAAERLTGRKAATLTHRRWSSKLMGLRDENGEELDEASCPLHSLIATHLQYSSRLQVRHVDGKSFKVNFTAVPVFAGREFTGAILLVRDASDQANLEARVQSLHLIASHDPLTKVANRAELDRRLPEFLGEHVGMGVPGSLIICDLDHFKRINDNFGHQAGDEALVTFSTVLKGGSREGDLVARYGGEEFVVLCAGCDNPSATSRAEEIRRAIERTPISAIENNTLTASFGVTEIQPGDSSTTLLARADRALLVAKSTGRNRVVQLGAGHGPNLTFDERRPLCPKQKASWLGWFKSVQESAIIETERLASVPHFIAIQKLQGFISDHRADVLKADEYQVTLRIDGQKYNGGRRKGERAAIMLMEVTFQPVDYRTSRTNAFQSKTKLSIVIRPAKARDRRSDVLLGQATQLLVSFNSYLVAQEITDEMREFIVDAR